MKFAEIVRSIFLSISANKVRVLMTSLGIIIGTFTIIMVVGIGKASEDAVEEQYKRLSVETITIARNAASGPMRIGGNTAANKSLTKDLAEDMPDSLTYVEKVGVSTSISSPVVYGSQSETVSILGITEDYADITNLNVESGEMFTDQDGVLRNRYAVLGYNIAESLFGEDFGDVIGEKVQIKGLTFTVTGILERIGGSGGISSGGRNTAASPDDSVFIPYEVAVRYTSGGSSATVTSSGGVRMTSGLPETTFVALATSIKDVDAAITEIQDYIYDITGDYTSYNVTDAGSILSAALETSNTMSALLLVVAVIVLIVSGIGIMNVMMVAVKERTREVGILKSIGSSRSVILMLFLFEAVFISVCGGLVGAAASYFAPALLVYLHSDFSHSLRGLLLGFMFSVATGVFFGYYPAHKASKLAPIVALNAD
ncbi:MAG: ABC transporter permease [Oscillospiraceae bacterium]|nr:ABC transporter permease [Oscillospiraceae bacterium]